MRFLLFSNKLTEKGVVNYNVAMKVILASGSPRRKQLLGELLADFVVCPSNAEEKPVGTTPIEIVESLAVSKASGIDIKDDDCVVIGADTIVVLDDEAIGKPHSVAQAQATLSKLSGRTHKVFTGVCIKGQNKREIFHVVSQVTFYKLTPKQISDYIATGSPFDKAGGYGVQDSGFVEKIVGSYTNVMGLPLEELKLKLKDFTEEDNE